MGLGFRVSDYLDSRVLAFRFNGIRYSFLRSCRSGILLGGTSVIAIIRV